TFQPHRQSSLWSRSSFWFGSHGPVLAFYPSFVSPLRSWHITLIGKYTSFPTFLPNPQSYLPSWSSFRPLSSFWFGSHGPVLAFYPSFVSPLRSWHITLIGKYTSFPT